MVKELNETLRNKENQRIVINSSVKEYLSKGGVIDKLPTLDDATSQSLLRNLEDYMEFQHLDSSEMAKSSRNHD